MSGADFARFWMDYVATWPTVIAFGPFVMIAAGTFGHRLAKAILAGKTPLAGAEWILYVGIFTYLLRSW